MPPYSNHWSIVRNNRESYNAVKAGDCLSNHDKLYTELYNHFASNGDMPYGIMKARTGDPIEWIMEQVWN
jgi:hypothetical protein